MILFQRNKYRGMSLITLLIALMLFTGIFLAVNQWAAQQRREASEIFQRYQAMQILDNQQQRLFLGLDCEHSIKQNGLEFLVECANGVIKVRYPMGEFGL